MGLSWNISKVNNYEELTEENEWNKTESIIFYTMLIGMPGISESNCAEFYSRIHLYERLFGSILYSVDENNNRVDFPITFGDIERRIGLNTNASSIPKTKFKNSMVQRFFDEVAKSVGK